MEKFPAIFISYSYDDRYDMFDLYGKLIAKEDKETGVNRLGFDYNKYEELKSLVGNAGSPKLLLVGNGRTGKTSILKRYLKSSRETTPKPNIAPHRNNHLLLFDNLEAIEKPRSVLDEVKSHIADGDTAQALDLLMSIKPTSSVSKEVWEWMRGEENIIVLVISELRERYRDVVRVVKILVTNYKFNYYYVPDFSYWYEYLDLTNTDKGDAQSVNAGYANKTLFQVYKKTLRYEIVRKSNIRSFAA